MAGRVGGDHTGREPICEQRPELVGVEPGAAQTVPVEDGGPSGVAPLVHEERSARRLGDEGPHVCRQYPT